ncbi:hypothetical protein H4Q26_005993 [Puccinia striiformis f. sp. tritici PST-130]|nr:hypothetical protein H4Q26_005993 [Puccinia striiformis f. sp. tritici PST-130]
MTYAFDSRVTPCGARSDRRIRSISSSPKKMTSRSKEFRQSSQIASLDRIALGGRPRSFQNRIRGHRRRFE